MIKIFYAIVSLLTTISTISIFAYSTQEYTEDSLPDINRDGIIQKGEAIMTVVGYFEGNVTKAVAINVVIAYFTGHIVIPGIFSINNMDSSEHDINIQILYPNNTQFINRTYKLEPSDSVSYPETEWQNTSDRDRLFPNGTYIFKTVLDGNITNIYRNMMDTWSEVRIDIVKENVSI